MVLSIGYQKLDGYRLLRSLVTRLDAKLIDCRGLAVSRKPGWSGKALQAEFKERYEWRGDVLGNKPPHITTNAGVQAIADEFGGEKNCILLCLEEAPGECHRHHKIAVRLLGLDVETYHIFEDEVVEASELARAMKTKSGEYQCYYLDDFLEEHE